MELKIIPKDEQLKQSVKSCLEAALGEEYDGVIVFGIKDGGYVYPTMSTGVGRLQFIGALEVAKMEKWGKPIHE